MDVMQENRKTEKGNKNIAWAIETFLKKGNHTRFCAIYKRMTNRLHS